MTAARILVGTSSAPAAILATSATIRRRLTLLVVSSAGQPSGASRWGQGGEAGIGQWRQGGRIYGSNGGSAPSDGRPVSPENSQSGKTAPSDMMAACLMHHIVAGPGSSGS